MPSTSAKQQCGKKFRGIRGCRGCHKSFRQMYTQQKYCSKICQFDFASKKYLMKSNEDIETQLRRLSLRLSRGRSRKHLTSSFLMKMWNDQNGRCSISGVEMTCIKFKGRVSTNISIDRRDPRKGYTRSNVHLVCDLVNMMKRTLPLKDFISWCDLISEKNNAFRQQKTA